MDVAGTNILTFVDRAFRVAAVEQRDVLFFLHGGRGGESDHLGGTRNNRVRAHSLKTFPLITGMARIE